RSSATHPSVRPSLVRPPPPADRLRQSAVAGPTALSRRPGSGVSPGEGGAYGTHGSAPVGIPRSGRYFRVYGVRDCDRARARSRGDRSVAGRGDGSSGTPAGDPGAGRRRGVRAGPGRRRNRPRPHGGVQPRVRSLQRAAAGDGPGYELLLPSVPRGARPEPQADRPSRQLHAAGRARALAPRRPGHHPRAPVPQERCRAQDVRALHGRRGGAPRDRPDRGRHGALHGQVRLLRRARLLRVALGQITPTVGDLEGNVRMIGDAIERARALGASLVAFPELAITGYPPEDLLFKPAFIEANLKALDEVTRASRGLSVVVGFVDKRDDIFNAAAVLHDGIRAGVYHKQYLPNYGVFDENRYFQAGTE